MLLPPRCTVAPLAALLALALAACNAPAPAARLAPDLAPTASHRLPTAVILVAPHAIAREDSPPRALVPSATPEPTAAPPSATAEPTVALPSATPEPYAAIAPELRAPQRIIVASIGLDRGLVSVGLDAADIPVVPDHDVAWYNRSARPGGGDNVVVWGHALRFSSTPDLPAPLERMKLAGVGDTVQIVTADGATFTYVIRDQVWARPEEVAYILPKGSEQLTIVNCIGAIVITDGEVDMSHRLITIAEPQF